MKSYFKKSNIFKKYLQEQTEEQAEQQRYEETQHQLAQMKENLNKL
jgi:hypothetical protein